MHPGLPETSKMESFVTIIKGYKPLTMVARLSILDVCGGLGCAFDFMGSLTIREEFLFSLKCSSGFSSQPLYKTIKEFLNKSGIDISDCRKQDFIICKHVFATCRDKVIPCFGWEGYFFI